MNRRAFRILLPVVALLLIGCATGRRDSYPPATALFVVRNDLVPADPITVRVYSPNQGTRQFLGTVSSGTTRSFELRLPVSGIFQLEAQRSRGSAIQSRPFSIGPGAEAVWFVRSNTLSIED